MTTPGFHGGAPHCTPCRIGLWGTFESDGLDADLVTRIARRELSQRLPAAEITALMPHGCGPSSADRVADLAVGLDCLMVTGDGLFGPRDAGQADRFLLGGLASLEGRCPVMWHAVTLASEPPEAQAAELVDALAGTPYVGVSDDASKQWLQAAGVDCEIVVLPHPALLTSRLFPSSLIEKRLEYLRVMGWYPGDGRPLVVQGDGSPPASVHDLAADLEKLAAGLGAEGIVVLQDPRRGDDFAAALAGALTRAPYRPPALGVEDTAACVAGSFVVVASSPALAATALSYGRPHTPTGDPCGLESWIAPEELCSRQEELDASFDHMASVAHEAAAARLDHGDSAPDVEELLATLSRLRRAHEIQGRRMAEERLVLADQVIDLGALHKAALMRKDSVIASQQRSIEMQTAELERSRAILEQVRASADDLRAGLAAAEAHAAAAEAQVAATEAELAALRATRTFRWTAPARTLLARLQRLAR
jgi:hypothetical protein